MDNIDPNDPTWRKVIAWAEERKASSAAAMLSMANTRDRDMFLKGKCDSFSELLSADTILKQGPSDE